MELPGAGELLPREIVREMILGASGIEVLQRFCIVSNSFRSALNDPSVLQMLAKKAAESHVRLYGCKTEGYGHETRRPRVLKEYESFGEYAAWCDIVVLFHTVTLHIACMRALIEADEHVYIQIHIVVPPQCIWI